ncbi:hypothetical protein MMPV_001487 [Pyropia vietnamensis]
MEALRRQIGAAAATASIRRADRGPSGVPARPPSHLMRAGGGGGAGVGARGSSKGGGLSTFGGGAGGLPRFSVSSSVDMPPAVRVGDEENAPPPPGLGVYDRGMDADSLAGYSDAGGVSSMGMVSLDGGGGKLFRSDVAAPSSRVDTAGGTDDEDGGDIIDVPNRYSRVPGSAAALMDLHRCSLRVQKELQSTLGLRASGRVETMLSPPSAGAGGLGDAGGSGDGGGLSRAQGELWWRHPWTRMYRRRFGSIVDHEWFGPVLFLFKYDGKGNVALKRSCMVVLHGSSVKLGGNKRGGDGRFRCEFKLVTTKRAYGLACRDTMKRDYWLEELGRIQSAFPAEGDGYDAEGY